MVSTVSPTLSLSLAAFLAMPQGDQGWEFYDGAIAPKMAPKRLHAGLQRISAPRNYPQSRSPQWP